MRKRLVAGCLIAAAVLTSVCVLGQDEKVDVDGLMKNFFAASTEKKVSHAVNLMRFAGVDPLDIEKRLRAGREYSKKAKTGWQVLYNECTDGVKRPYHLYVPEDYDPAKKYPVFYDLHGGVSRPQIVPVEQLTNRRRLWGPSGKEKGFIVIIPHAQAGALWWDKVGSANILAQLDYAKRHYNVDENKVFVSGFSDGASGAYWMALHKPTSLAGFVPLSGNMLVARAGPYQSYPTNLLNRPIHATNGGRDGLYPSAAMKKLIDQIKKIGVDIDWKNYPEAGHNLSYIVTEMPRVLEFVEKTKRNPAPSEVVWETANTEVGRCDWVRIDEIKDVGNNHGFQDFNLTSVPGRLVLGVVIDQNYNGPGVRIQTVQEGSVADKAGLSAGDIITKLDDTAVANLNDLRRVLGAKKFGDKVTGEYKRAEATQQFSGQFPKHEARPIFRRKEMTGTIEAKAKGNRIDVRAKNIARYTLFVSSKQFNLDEPIQVFTNGEQTFNARVSPDLVFMLKQFARDNDRTTVYCAKIEIKVPAKEAEDEEEEQEKENPEEEGK